MEPERRATPWTEQDIRNFIEDPIRAHVREKVKKGALEAGRMISPALCHEPRRAAVLSSLKEYYFHRSNQIGAAEGLIGAQGREMMEKRWNEAADKQIDASLRDLYRNGYIDRKIITHRSIPRLMAEVVQNIVVERRMCSQSP